MKDSWPLRRLLLLVELLPVDIEEEQVNSSGRHLQSGFDVILTPPPLLDVRVVVLAPTGDNVVVVVVVVVASRV